MTTDLASLLKCRRSEIIDQWTGNDKEVSPAQTFSSFFSLLLKGLVNCGKEELFSDTRNFINHCYALGLTLHEIAESLLKLKRIINAFLEENYSDHEVNLDQFRQTIEQEIENHLITIIKFYHREHGADLFESAQQYKILTDSSLTGIFIHQYSKYVFVNDRFAEMHGYTPDELLGTDHLDLIHPDQRESIRQRADKRLKGEKVPQQYEIKRIKKDGTTVWHEIFVSDLISYRGKSAIMGHEIDITLRKQVEEEIIQKNEELGNFVYTISHDLKSPIVSLQGFASILLEEYSKRLDDEGRHYINRIQENANKMEQLIEDLLQLSRLGRVANIYEKIESGHLVQEIIDTLRFQMDDNRIDLKIQDNLPIIYCDRSRVVQVFENLISNAIKYMGNVKAPIIEIGHRDKPPFVEFNVKDNGIGIEPQYHNKIFRLFERLHGSEVEGTGVGLTIVKRIIEAHGGRIWLDSQKGKGANFYFTLPGKEPG